MEVGVGGVEWTGALFWAFKVESICKAYLSVYGAEWVRIGALRGGIQHSPSSGITVANCEACSQLTGLRPLER